MWYGGAELLGQLLCRAVCPAPAACVLLPKPSVCSQSRAASGSASHFPTEVPSALRQRFVIVVSHEQMAISGALCST